MYNGADGVLPDFIDSGQRMHHYHLLFGYSHDVRGEDELAKTLRKNKKQSHKADLVKKKGKENHTAQLLIPCYKK